MESNFWFYTLSAIPQTLGTIIALVAAFSVFKFSKIYELTEKCAQEVKDYLYPLLDKEIHDIENMGPSDIASYLKVGLKKMHKTDPHYSGYDKLYSLFQGEISQRHRNFQPTPERIYGFLKQKQEYISKLLVERINAKHKLFVSFFLNITTIVVSLVLLPMYDFLNQFPTILLVIVMAVISLIYTIYSAWKIAIF